MIIFVGTTSSLERKEILAKIELIPCRLFLHGFLIFIDKMNFLKNLYDILKEREAQGITINLLAYSFPHPSIGTSISNTIGVSSVSPGVGQPFLRLIMHLFKTKVGLVLPVTKGIKTRIITLT